MTLTLFAQILDGIHKPRILQTTPQTNYDKLCIQDARSEPVFWAPVSLSIGFPMAAFFFFRCSEDFLHPFLGALFRSETRKALHPTLLRCSEHLRRFLASTGASDPLRTDSARNATDQGRHLVSAPKHCTNRKKTWTLIWKPITMGIKHD